jgi:hypothetical protein
MSLNLGWAGGGAEVPFLRVFGGVDADQREAGKPANGDGFFLLRKVLIFSGAGELPDADQREA